MVRLTRIGARPTDGSSTSRIFGASISARAERQHLLLAAAHRAGELRAALGEPREGLEAELEIGLDLRARLRAERAEQQILLDGQTRKQPAAFRHQRDAEIDDLLGGEADEIVLSRRRSRR